MLILALLSLGFSECLRNLGAQMREYNDGSYAARCL